MERKLKSILSQKHGNLVLSQIVEKKEDQYKGLVYDIHVENKHSYTVDNIVVHNSSGASLIAYLTGITRIDPIEWNFNFERFLNSRKVDTEGERVRVITDQGVIDYRPNDIVKLKNGTEKKAKELKNGEEIL